MNADEVAAQVAELFLAQAGAAISAGRRFAVAVPGGSVATRVFPRLASLPLDWPSIDVTWVDERVVPASDPDSNRCAADDHWLARISGPGPRLIVPPVDLGSPDRVAAAWQTALVDALGDPPRLDVAILGVGPDGHVASLFPGHPALMRTDAWALGVDDSPKPPPARVTLTLATLAHARELWFVAFGREKAAAMTEARSGQRSSLPAAVLARSGPAVRWFLDDAAAGG